MDEKNVSVIIPAYKEERLLPNLLEKLIEEDDYNNKEIIVIFDEPTKNALRSIQKFKDKITLIINNERKGKVYALNLGGRMANGELLVFLDNDVTLNNKDFIRRIVEEMKGYDIGEILKVIIKKRSFISRMVYYDYLASMYGNYLFYKFIGKCVGFNGAAFVMTKKTFIDLDGFRPVITEDMDFGTRSFIKNKKFKFIKSIRVFNDPPESIQHWYKQRRRWSIGAGLWIKEYGRFLLRIVKENAKIVLPVLLTLFPSFVTLVLVLLLSSAYTENALLILLLTLSSKLSFLIPFTLFTSYYLYFIKTLIATLTSTVFFAIYFYFISRELKAGFNPVEFAIYYLIYSPAWFIVTLSGIIKALISEKIKLDDWKIPE